ncbi:MAG TPA: bifunctional acyl-ACP--phospholipid O-acyltransferase/long-chain-fatty-acid--ACP ligase [Bryobacteraceae bacterium]|nr:bifunctional acyl-ACP--phospholipid O-acyltransferase/long-chain-fatty-acid--ACP ligase [Bryobacteraceae bacterium]
MVAFVARILLRLFFRVEVHGELRPHERLLIIANHGSFLDGILIGAFLPLWPTYLVHTTIARIWYFKLGLSFLPHLVVDTANPLAMKAIINLIDSGTPVVIFPEGRITQTAALMKIYDGPAFVAAKTGATVVPVYIEGAVHSLASRMSGDFPRKLFPKIRLSILSPSTIPMPEGRTAKIRRRAASDEMRKIMQRAAFEARRPSTIVESLLDAVDLHGKGRLVLEDIKQVPQSYSQILKGALALGRLAAKFTQERETVGILLPNVSATVSLIFGLMGMRRIPAMLNYTAGPDGMQSACDISKVRVVFTSRAFIEKAKLGAAIEGLKNVRILYLEDLKSHFSAGDKLWLLGYALRFPRLAMKASRPEDPAVVLFTSGSEGKPKGVVLSHASILANVAQIQAVIEFSSKDKFMSALPLFHAFGLTAGAILPLLSGTRIFLYPSPLHYRVIPELIYDRDCTVLFATNTFLGNYAKVAHPYDFYRIRHLVVGAEKLTEDVQKLCFEKFGVRPLEGYGATECSPVLSVNTPMAYRPGTVGELLPGIEHRLQPVPGIENGGALHVRGPNVMLGYFKEDKPGEIQPPRSEFGDGWYNTGDIVSMDGGFVTLQGRIRRFAKVAGEMVSLELVERIAAAAEPRFLHASASIKDASRGEAIILLTLDATLQRERLQASARAIGAPEIAVPRRIIYIEKMPLLGNGKKDYVALSKMANQLTEGRSA